MTLHRLLALLAAAAVFAPQLADAGRARGRGTAAPRVRPAQRQQQQNAPGRIAQRLPRGEDAAAREAARRRAAEEREIVRRHLTERRRRVRARGQIFRNIAVDRQYKGEYLLMRDHKVTAFLDITDPAHPAFDPRREVEEEALESIPPERRAHIIVVPTQPREHITRSLGSTITSSDLRETLEVVEAAESLARRLGIKNPRVFVNPESRVTIGYLHVHIIGERPAGHSYPPPLR